MAAEPTGTPVPVQGGDEEQGAAADLRADAPVNEPEDLKRRIYLLTEEPSSSNLATAVAAFVLLCICLSTACFILETVPALESYTMVWFYAEIFFVSVFTVEYIARFWSTPLPKWKFVIEPFNMVDLLAIAPFYIELMLPGNALDLRVLRALRLLRLFRLFKVGKYSSNTQLIALALGRSVEALVLMVFFVGMAMILFATLMYMAEAGVWDDELGCKVRAGESSCTPMSSIAHTFYWAITTMTTVGYGDVLPKTPLGKFVAGLTMVCGIVVIALPVTMIGGTFVDTHVEIKEATNRKRVKEGTKDDHEVLKQLYACTEEFDGMKAECEEVLTELKRLLACRIVMNGDQHTAIAALNEMRPSYDIFEASEIQAMDDLNMFVKTSLPERYR